MLMLIETFQFLIKVISELWVLLLLMRFYLQLVKFPYHHPLSMFVVSCTDFAVKPTRKLIRPYKNYDVATLLVAWLVSMMWIVLVLALNPTPFDFALPHNWLMFCLLAVLSVFRQSLYLLMGAVIVRVVMSWINPYHALRGVLDSFTQPFLKPFSWAKIGVADLSAIVLFLVIQVIMMLPIQALENIFTSQIKMAL